MEKIAKNSVTIALIVLRSNRKKEVISLMIPKGSGCEANKQGRWHYFAVKILSASLRGITFKHHEYFYCLNCLHSFAI